MSEAKESEEPTVRPFAEFLVQQANGRTHTELSDALHKVVAAVKETGKTGKVQLTVDVKPIAPFEVGELYRVTARIRYRLESGGLRLGYKLDRVDDILRQAFADVVKDVQQRTGENVLYGTPPRAAA